MSNKHPHTAGCFMNLGGAGGAQSRLTLRLLSDREDGWKSDDFTFSSVVWCVSMATVYKRGSCVLLRPKGIKRFQKYSDAHIQLFCSRWKITQTRVNVLLYTAARSTICRRHTTQSVRSTFHSLNLTGVMGPLFLFWGTMSEETPSWNTDKHSATMS